MHHHRRPLQLLPLLPQIRATQLELAELHRLRLADGHGHACRHWDHPSLTSIQMLAMRSPTQTTTLTRVPLRAQGALVSDSRLRASSYATLPRCRLRLSRLARLIWAAAHAARAQHDAGYQQVSTEVYILFLKTYHRVVYLRGVDSHRSWSENI
jgi:hypothetical protein